MARGFIRGVLWGTGVSLSAVTLMSVMDDGPNKASVMERVAPAGEQVTQELASVPARTVGSGPSAVGLNARDVPAPEPDTLAGLLSDALNPAAVPQTGRASDLSAAPVPSADAIDGISRPGSQAPQIVYSESAALTTPETDPGLSISTLPAQPLAPEPEPQALAFGAPQDAEAPDEVAQNDSAGDASFDVVTDVEVPRAPEVGLETASGEVFSDPVQPVPPSISDTSTTLVARDQPLPTEPDAMNLGPLPDRGVAATTENVADAASVESTMPEPAPVESAPLVVDVPIQPVTQRAQVDAPAPISTEARGPEISNLPELPTPIKVTQSTEKAESASVPVISKVVIEVQEPALAVGQIEILAKQIMPAPNRLTAQSLPSAIGPDVKVRDGVTETAIAPPVQADVSVPVEAVPEKQTPAEQAVEVRVNRLPTLGAVVPSETDRPVEISETPSASMIDARPVDRFAATFDNAQAMPLMAVVLIDDGVDLSAETTGLDALRALPYPVSFAVDALLPDAAQRMQAYRSAGFEVLASVDLPAGATAVDAEVNLAVALEAMPEVVAVLDGVGTGVQTTPDAGRQVAQILSQTGHGFVTQNRGLNTVQKLAARNGVPSGVVFRDFDAKGQNATVIRRFLDQAAFRAGQEGAVIMLGRLREETVSALLLWTLQDRAATVVMSPVSAALRVQ